MKRYELLLLGLHSGTGLVQATKHGPYRASKEVDKESAGHAIDRDRTPCAPTTT